MNASTYLKCDLLSSATSAMVVVAVPGRACKRYTNKQGGSRIRVQYTRYNGCHLMAWPGLLACLLACSLARSLASWLPVGFSGYFTSLSQTPSGGILRALEPKPATFGRGPLAHFCRRLVGDIAYQPE